MFDVYRFAPNDDELDDYTDDQVDLESDIGDYGGDDDDDADDDVNGEEEPVASATTDNMPASSGTPAVDTAGSAETERSR